MATLYVENVPDKLYDALRARARKHRTSIASEVITLLQENVPTADELRRRREFYRTLEKLRSQPSPGSGPFPPTEQMQREDRER